MDVTGESFEEYVTGLIKQNFSTIYEDDCLCVCLHLEQSIYDLQTLTLQKSVAKYEKYTLIEVNDIEFVLETVRIAMMYLKDLVRNQEHMPVSFPRWKAIDEIHVAISSGVCDHRQTRRRKQSSAVIEYDDRDRKKKKNVHQAYAMNTFTSYIDAERLTAVFEYAKRVWKILRAKFSNRQCYAETLFWAWYFINSCRDSDKIDNLKCVPIVSDNLLEDLTFLLGGFSQVFEQSHSIDNVFTFCESLLHGYCKELVYNNGRCFLTSSNSNDRDIIVFLKYVMCMLNGKVSLDSNHIDALQLTQVVMQKCTKYVILNYIDDEKILSITENILLTYNNTDVQINHLPLNLLAGEDSHAFSVHIENKRIAVISSVLPNIQEKTCITGGEIYITKLQKALLIHNQNQFKLCRYDDNELLSSVFRSLHRPLKLLPLLPYQSIDSANVLLMLTDQEEDAKRHSVADHHLFFDDMHSLAKQSDKDLTQLKKDVASLIHRAKPKTSHIYLRLGGDLCFDTEQHVFVTSNNETNTQCIALNKICQDVISVDRTPLYGTILAYICLDTDSQAILYKLLVYFNQTALISCLEIYCSLYTQLEKYMKLGLETHRNDPCLVYNVKITDVVQRLAKSSSCENKNFWCKDQANSVFLRNTACDEGCVLYHDGTDIYVVSVSSDGNILNITEDIHFRMLNPSIENLHSALKEQWFGSTNARRWFFIEYLSFFDYRWETMYGDLFAANMTTVKNLFCRMNETNSLHVHGKQCIFFFERETRDSFIYHCFLSNDDKKDVITPLVKKAHKLDLGLGNTLHYNVIDKRQIQPVLLTAREINSGIRDVLFYIEYNNSDPYDMRWVTASDLSSLPSSSISVSRRLKITVYRVPTKIIEFTVHPLIYEHQLSISTTITNVHDLRNLLRLQKELYSTTHTEHERQMIHHQTVEKLENPMFVAQIHFVQHTVDKLFCKDILYRRQKLYLNTCVSDNEKQTCTQNIQILKENQHTIIGIEY